MKNSKINYLKKESAGKLSLPGINIVKPVCFFSAITGGSMLANTYLCYV